MTAPAQVSPADIPDTHDYLILDVREAQEWALVHLPGSLHLPLGQLSRRWQELPTDRHILCLCHHGMRSQRAADFLAARGFRVSNLSGGIDRWAREKDPRLARY